MSNGYYRFGGGGSGIPDGIKYLLIWNGIVYLLQNILVRNGLALEPLFGLVPVLVWHGFVWQPITYMFLHGGVFHILINMFILWMFGSDLERILGTRRFVALYFFAGIGAALLNAVVTPHSPVPTVGASGAIYGILVGYALYFPERRVLLYFLIPIPARLFVILLGVLALVNSLGQPGSQISHISHLGGFIFGWLYLKGLGPGDLLRRMRGGRRRPRVIDFTRERGPWG